VALIDEVGGGGGAGGFSPVENRIVSVAWS
jgi:hypothetical protein